MKRPSSRALSAGALFGLLSVTPSEALPRGAPQHSQIDRRAPAREAGRIELLLAAEWYGSRANSLQKIRNQVKLAL